MFESEGAHNGGLVTDDDGASRLDGVNCIVRRRSVIGRNSADCPEAKARHG